MLGPIFGVVVLYGLYNLIGITEPQYFQLIYGVLIMVLVLFLPQGIASLAGEGSEKMSSETVLVARDLAQELCEA